MGTIIGVLFGLPELYVRADASASSGRAPGAAGDAPQAPALRDNTNLEDVSDWLTKIIIGLGVARFGEAIGLFAGVAHGVAVGMGPADRISGNETVAAAALLYGAVCGLLFYDLWARGHLYRSLLEREG